MPWLSDHAYHYGGLLAQQYGGEHFHIFFVGGGPIVLQQIKDVREGQGLGVLPLAIYKFLLYITGLEAPG